MSPMLASFGGLAGFGMLPGGVMESIGTITVGSGGASSIEFTDIPGTYQHLQVRSLLRQASTGGLASVRVRVNGVSTTSYTWHYIQGNGLSASAGALTGQTGTFVAYNSSSDTAANIFAASIIDIFDYASTTKNKTLRGFYGADINGAGGVLQLASGLFQSTSAITSVSLTPFAGGNWAQYSTAALYGLRAP